MAIYSTNLQSIGLFLIDLHTVCLYLQFISHRPTVEPNIKIVGLSTGYFTCLISYILRYNRYKEPQYWTLGLSEFHGYIEALELIRQACKLIENSLILWNAEATANVKLANSELKEFLKQSIGANKSYSRCGPSLFETEMGNVDLTGNAFRLKFYYATV